MVADLQGMVLGVDKVAGGKWDTPHTGRDAGGSTSALVSKGQGSVLPITPIVDRVLAVTSEGAEQGQGAGGDTDAGGGSGSGSLAPGAAVDWMLNMGATETEVAAALAAESAPAAAAGGGGEGQVSSSSTSSSSAANPAERLSSLLEMQQQLRGKLQSQVQELQQLKVQLLATTNEATPPAAAAVEEEKEAEAGIPDPASETAAMDAKSSAQVFETLAAGGSAGPHTTTIAAGGGGGEVVEGEAASPAGFSEWTKTRLGKAQKGLEVPAAAAAADKDRGAMKPKAGGAETAAATLARGGNKMKGSSSTAASTAPSTRSSGSSSKSVLTESDVVAATARLESDLQEALQLMSALEGSLGDFKQQQYNLPSGVGRTGSRGGGRLTGGKSGGVGSNSSRGIGAGAGGAGRGGRKKDPREILQQMRALQGGGGGVGGGGGGRGGGNGGGGKSGDGGGSWWGGFPRDARRWLFWVGRAWLGVVVFLGMGWYSYEVMFKIPMREVQSLGSAATSVAKAGVGLAQRVAGVEEGEEEVERGKEEGGGKHGVVAGVKGGLGWVGGKVKGVLPGVRHGGGKKKVGEGEGVEVGEDGRS